MLLVKDNVARRAPQVRQAAEVRQVKQTRMQAFETVHFTSADRLWHQAGAEWCSQHASE